MEYKDYYKILGVNKDADEKEIKKAYRRLARELHPDVNDAPDAAERFKDVNEAYQVLSDPDKRAKYDQLGASYQRWQQTGGGAGTYDWSQWSGGFPGGQRVEYTGSSADIFSEFFRVIFGSNEGFRAASGAGDFDELLQQAYGTPRTERARERQRGRDLDTEVEVTLEEAFHGTTRLISKDGSRKQVKIPRGVRTGTKVRIAGEGMVGRTGQAGDLYLIVKVLEDERFERDGDDLYEDILIDLYTAVLGGEVQVETVTGKVTLRINEGTQNGQLIRLRGRGMPKLKQADQYGDLYVRVNVEVPANLTEREKALFRELARMYLHGPYEGEMDGENYT
ncbi:MAG: J domain-containing protein [Chloroflexi bacterium]|nr:J domain-containing protein [Chloroflexota bacterium]